MLCQARLLLALLSPRSPETHKLELCLQPCDEPKGPQTHFRFFAKILVLFAPVILVAAPDCSRTVFGDEAHFIGYCDTRGISCNTQIVLALEVACGGTVLASFLSSL